MMLPIETIHGQIIPKANNYKAVPDRATGGRRIIKSDKIRAYEQSFAAQCKVYAGQRIDQPFELITTIYYSSTKFDLDNSLKTLLDCLQYVGAITNDNLCMRITADKKIDKYNPRVEFAVLAPDAPPTLFD